MRVDEEGFGGGVGSDEGWLTLDEFDGWGAVVGDCFGVNIKFEVDDGYLS